MLLLLLLLLRLLLLYSYCCCCSCYYADDDDDDYDDYASACLPPWPSNTAKQNVAPAVSRHSVTTESSMVGRQPRIPECAQAATTCEV